jgi:hypothetical protein
MQRQADVRLSSLCFASGVILAGSVYARTSRAADDQPPPFPPMLAPTPTVSGEPEWFGWQLILVDVVSDTLIFAERSDGNSPINGNVLGIGGVAGYLGGSLSVHISHHQRAGLIAGSVALRVVLPVLGFVVGGLLGSCDRPPPVQGGYSIDLNLLCFNTVSAGTGAMVTLLVAEVVDDWVLAYDPPRVPTATAAASAPSLALAPNVASYRDGEQRLVPVFGVTGAF